MITDPEGNNGPLVVITGGQGDLGQAMARELRFAKFQVRAPGKDELDVTRQDSVDHFFKQLPEPVNLLINNAGCLRDKRLLNLSDADWQDLFDTHLKGAWRCTRAVLPGMRKEGKGHLLFISSYSALSGPIGQAGYAAAKAGLLGLSHSLAIEYGGYSIRANAILPGFLETRMTRDLPPQIVNAIRDEHALGRFNTPQAVARFARFLHEELENVSGQVFQLDSRRRPPGW